ncbi:MAG: hypothetical protein ACW99Q_13600 [Candidatus Kariarchaeaceae archaeon]
MREHCEYCGQKATEDAFCSGCDARLFTQPEHPISHQTFNHYPFSPHLKPRGDFFTILVRPDVPNNRILDLLARISMAVGLKPREAGPQSLKVTTGSKLFALIVKKGYLSCTMQIRYSGGVKQVFLQYDEQKLSQLGKSRQQTKIREFFHEFFAVVYNAIIDAGMFYTFNYSYSDPNEVRKLDQRPIWPNQPINTEPSQFRKVKANCPECNSYNPIGKQVCGKCGNNLLI